MQLPYNKKVPTLTSAEKYPLFVRIHPDNKEWLTKVTEEQNFTSIGKFLDALLTNLRLEDKKSGKKSKAA